MRRTANKAQATSMDLRRISQIQTMKMKELDKQVVTFKIKLWRLQVMFGIPLELGCERVAMMQQLWQHY